MDKNFIDENNFFDEFNNHIHLPISYESHWQPFFDDRKDFNTNANSYYEYLAHLNHLTKALVSLLNRVARRNINVFDTASIDFTKKFDWISENSCNEYHDVIQLMADVKRSKTVLNNEVILNHVQKIYKLSNAIKEYADGLFVKDFSEEIDDLFINSEKLLKKIEKEIEDRKKDDSDLEKDYNKKITDLTNNLQNLNNNHNELVNNYNNLKNKYEKTQQALLKILENLKNSGAWNSGTDIESGTFNQNRNIATGNINIFGGTPDGNSFIRTNNGATENDLAGGV